MPDVLRHVRTAIEAFVPWFDRADAERSSAETRKEIAASRAARRSAIQSIARRYERFDRAVRR